MFAAAPGVVTRIERAEFTGSGSAYGVQIRIEATLADGQAYEVIYAHLEAVEQALAVGSDVARGQRIGTSDNTGHSTAAHLHLAVKKRGATARGEKQQLRDGTWVVYPSDLVNPEPFLSKV